MSSVLCVSGMHRSGTSLTASWLESCGLPIHDGKFHGPATGNPRGHFEDQEFVELHAAEIRAQEPESGGWRSSAGKEFPFRPSARATARRLTRERSDKYPAWGWKDPRTVFFLEQWKAIIPKLKVLLVWRPCHLVVDSLLRRSESATNPVFKVARDEAESMWLAYNDRVCAYKESHREDTLLVPIEFAVHNDRAVYRAIRDRLGIGLEYEPLSRLFDVGLMTTGGSASDHCATTATQQGRLKALSDFDV